MPGRAGQAAEIGLLGLVLLLYLVLLQGLWRLAGSAAPVLAALLPSLWLLGAALLWLRRRPLARLTWRGGPRAGQLVGLAGLSCLALVALALVHPGGDGLTGDPQLLAGRLALVLLVPAAEELYFRGLLLDHLVHAVGRPAAVVLVSVLFGFLHLPQGAPVQLVMTLLSAALCLLALRGGSVLWAVALHLGWNGLAVIRELPPGGERLLVTGAALAAMLVLAAVARTTRQEEPALGQLDGPALQQAQPR